MDNKSKLTPEQIAKARAFCETLFNRSKQNNSQQPQQPQQPQPQQPAQS